MLRHISSYVNSVVMGHASSWDDKVHWTPHAMKTYNTQLANTPNEAEILPLHPKLKAAIFYMYYTSNERLYLVGFSKYLQTYPRCKILTASYSANLYCFKDKLCYHKVRASSLEAAKLMVKQRDHACKKDPSDPQPVCSAGGMSYNAVKHHSNHLRHLLYTSSQQKPIKDNKLAEVEKLSHHHRQKRISSFRIK